MHYIRLLRPAKFDATDPRRPTISLLITVTTDLGDSFLYPDFPLDLIVEAHSSAGKLTTYRAKWSAGLRVLKLEIPVIPGLKKGDATYTLNISPESHRLPGGVLSTNHVLPWTIPSTHRHVSTRGLVMPATVKMFKGVCEPVSVRTLELPDNGLQLEVEEDIGESIARHIWDAGVVTASFLAHLILDCGDASAVLPVRKDTFNALELGTGVGILGITLARILENVATIQGRILVEAAVLLTDLPEAEERAKSNIARAETALSRSQSNGSVTTLQYENLDWDEGKLGRFGPLASSRPWDLVILSDCTYNVDSLPALIGTLSALHAANLKHPNMPADAETSVILATKPRHSSEEALFGLLEADAWRYRVIKSIPLPKLGEESEVVDIYLLEKGTGPT
ncbi:hypothetical protein M426DRAFT_325905 [Hypoxylon sp. CI-4A]|nr:hypothetical protein M426DRAFT_325905 [Hypoxylon sp. CI-4A]